MHLPDNDGLGPVPARVRRLGSFQSQIQAREWRREQERRRAEADHARLTAWMAWLAGASLAASAAHILLAVLLF